ncbi:hypothetical protein [Cellulomonas fimi]|uniref:Uncharacterized protein n=1 Tax=Cellulomonas fimi TaxID=1708 RepID=A0A7Y0LVA2_CELFI|nr:hypothetical protein [Cellulomonas fimi]NMR18715.1 hypothetical protein [Cellulomonas fimi]
MDASTRAVCTAAAAALVAAAAYVGELPLVSLVSALTLVFAIGWPRLADLPASRGAVVVLVLASAAAIAAVYRTAGEPYLRELPLVLAFSIVLAFVRELVRRDGRERLVESVSGVVAGVLVAVSVVGWVAAGRTAGGVPLVVTGAIALAVASAVSALPAAGWTGVLLTLAAGAGAGAGAGLLVPGIEPQVGALIGLAVGILGATLHELFDHLPSLRRRWAAVAGVVLPVSVTGVLVYVVGRVLVG